MSTRTNILLATEDGAIFQHYIHYDGYPEGVGCQLIEWLSNAYQARNESRLAQWAASVKSVADLPPECTLQHAIFDELRKHYRDSLDAKPGDMLEPEEVHDAGEQNELHGDIEFLYLIDMRASAESVRLLVLNVRSYDWKQVYIDSNQSYRAILADLLHNGLEMARFSYPQRTC